MAKCGWTPAANGIQDPGEAGIAAVTVSLYDEAETPVAQQITSPQGKHFFNDGNVPGGPKT